VTITVGVVAGLVVSWSIWWWVYRGDKRHGKHRTTLPPLPPPTVDLGPDTATWPAPRHTHRDPTTGRYTRKEQ